ncbi:hypothetical protein acsn021_04170 [Anaerocolumna cellulosilytica]|uniref:Uncharacterized protein n=1 Tax=Anaerocolumna cellulosilytica TaxID=433286 RepID=A0A6S6R1I2_9FIRM|nr:hypothetical protein [Anaerocolumna cellulosilytica]BCJ92848.1 hypothetical protein acsn021_04170 [Anaerocolumna cellulosilytica]
MLTGWESSEIKTSRDILNQNKSANETETSSTPLPTATLAPTSTPTPTSEPSLLDTMTIYEEGQYKVGVDIPAGEYKLASGTDSGYYCIYSDSRHDDILSNNNYTGNNYISVSEGDYLELVRCVIVQ